eukprot:3951806-Pyramimonas_sp.AAC.1
MGWVATEGREDTPRSDSPDPQPRSDGSTTVETHAKKYPACFQGALGFLGFAGFAMESVTLPRQ